VQMFVKRNKKNLLFYGGLFIVTLLYLGNFKMDMKTDDGWFMMISKEYNLLEFLKWRYANWSARLFPETMLYLIFLVPLFVHHFISACAWFLYSFSFVRLFHQQVSRKKFLLAFFSLGFIHVTIMKDALFWLTGATNYLWPLALGVFALIPYADSFFREKKTAIWPYILPALLFAFSNEQLIVCVVGIALVYHGAMLFKKRPHNHSLLVLTGLFVFGLLTMYFAPGNALRMEQEVAMWMPDFHKLSIFSRVMRGTSWLFEGWQTKLLLPFLLILVLSLLIDHSKVLAKITCGYLTFFFLLVYNFPDKFTNFRLISERLWVEPLKAGRFFAGPVVNAAAPYVLWLLFFGLIIALSITVTQEKIFVSLSYMAALLASVLMWLSPTMYASGARVFMCSSIFLIIILYRLYQQFTAKCTLKQQAYVYFYGCFIPVIHLLFVLLLR
jgi:hypothetical protein